jgi:hypothetical protein
MNEPGRAPAQTIVAHGPNTPSKNQRDDRTNPNPTFLIHLIISKLSFFPVQSQPSPINLKVRLVFLFPVPLVDSFSLSCPLIPVPPKQQQQQQQQQQHIYLLTSLYGSFLGASAGSVALKLLFPLFPFPFPAIGWANHSPPRVG